MNFIRPYDEKAVEAATFQLLAAMGVDLNSEGVLDTPRRVAKFWKEWIEYDSGKLGTLFSSETTNQMVVVRNIKGWSFCSHHLLPFSFTAAVGYIPNGKVIGLSKIPRIVQKYAHSLQMQEQLVEEIAIALAEIIESEDVAVVISGSHTCAQIRGVRSPDVELVNSAMHGAFLDNVSTRTEFFRLVQP